MDPPWKAPQQVAGERVDGILVVGGPDFIAATKAALTPYDPLKRPSGGFACRSRYW